MSRSLCDTALHAVGVSSEPEHTVYDLADEDDFVVLATDGVWDVLTPEDVARIIASHEHDVDVVGKAIAAAAERAWTLLCGFSYRDDITVLVVDVSSPRM